MYGYDSLFFVSKLKRQSCSSIIDILFFPLWSLDQHIVMTINRVKHSFCKSILLSFETIHINMKHLSKWSMIGIHISVARTLYFIFVSSETSNKFFDKLCLTYSQLSLKQKILMSVVVKAQSEIVKICKRRNKCWMLHHY